jgi:hypothetical protein
MHAACACDSARQGTLYCSNLTGPWPLPAACAQVISWHLHAMNCLAFLNRRYLGRKEFRGVPLSFTWVDSRPAGEPGAAEAVAGSAVAGRAGAAGHVAVEMRRAVAAGAAV